MVRVKGATGVNSSCNPLGIDINGVRTGTSPAVSEDIDELNAFDGEGGQRDFDEKQRAYRCHAAQNAPDQQNFLK